MEYFNVNRLLKEKSMPISVALLKYGYSNFSLTILEFCDINVLLTREKHYLDKYSPEYNILKTPGSPSQGPGRIFTAEHKKILVSELKKYHGLPNISLINL